MNRVLIVAAAIFACLVSGSVVRAQKVQYYYDAAANFSGFKTYKWQRAHDARYPDEQADAIIKKAVDDEMTKKGLTKTEADTADLYVIYQLAIVPKAEWSSFNTDVTWYGGANSLAGFGGVTTNSSHEFKMGWLILDMYDVSQKKQVWEATTTKTLGKGKDPQKMQKNAAKTMAKVFKGYPIPKK